MTVCILPKENEFKNYCLFFSKISEHSRGSFKKRMEKKVVWLVAGSSANPGHVGHVEMFKWAKNFLEKQGLGKCANVVTTNTV